MIAFLADTVAAHQIGGFKVGVNFALRKCRVCMATDADIQAKVTFYSFKHSMIWSTNFIKP